MICEYGSLVIVHTMMTTIMATTYHSYPTVWVSCWTYGAVTTAWRTADCIPQPYWWPSFQDSTAGCWYERHDWRSSDDPLSSPTQWKCDCNVARMPVWKPPAEKYTCISTKIKSTRKTYLSWWRHKMETFFVLLAICAGNSPVPGEFPAQRPVTRSFDVFFDLHLRINGWVNNGEAGDLRHHRAHYVVTVMFTIDIASHWCRESKTVVTAVLWEWSYSWLALINCGLVMPYDDLGQHWLK